MQVSLGFLNNAVPINFPDAASSDPITTGGMPFVGVKIPASFLGTSISFTVSESVGGTYEPMYKAGALFTYQVAASQYVPIDPKDFYGIAFMKIVSNTVETASPTLLGAFKGI